MKNYTHLPKVAAAIEQSRASAAREAGSLTPASARTLPDAEIDRMLRVCMAAVVYWAPGHDKARRFDDAVLSLVQATIAELCGLDIGVTPPSRPPEASVATKEEAARALLGAWRERVGFGQ